MFCSFFCDDPESSTNSLSPRDTNNTIFESIESPTATTTQQQHRQSDTSKMSSSRMSTVHMKPELDHTFSFRVDTDRDLLQDEPNTINDIVAMEDWHKVSAM